jgi:hypothetical protein
MIRVWTENGCVETDQQVNCVYEFGWGSSLGHASSTAISGRDRATAPLSHTRRAQALPGACFMQVNDRTMRHHTPEAIRHRHCHGNLKFWLNFEPLFR